MKRAKASGGTHALALAMTQTFGEVPAMTARDSTIEPFPDHIDRDRFGDWLSGFVDGEGHFSLHFDGSTNGTKRTLPKCYFVIRLRQDDINALKLIQSYWQCGFMTLQNPRKYDPPNAKPQANYTVASVPDLAKIVVAHFDRFPLYAKKKRDFLIWKQGVELAFEVRRRHRRRKPGQRGGLTTKWTDHEHAVFTQLHHEIRNIRKYETNGQVSDPIILLEHCERQEELFSCD
jgi:hypothetical protein